jgi:hypothetical protein
MSDWELAGIDFIIEHDYFGIQDPEDEQEVVAQLFQQQYWE